VGKLEGDEGVGLREEHLCRTDSGFIDETRRFLLLFFSPSPATVNTLAAGGV
jgi:hypothetical protein